MAATYALFFLMVGIALATCAFALVKGGAPERIGAAIILANLLATAANDAFLHDQRILLSIDGMTALALLPLALRYASFWLGAVMLLYGAQFGLHAFYFVLERPKDPLHVAINNANFFAIILCLAAGSVMAVNRRRRPKLTSGPAPLHPAP